jgi:hypothetical protein
MLTKKFEGLSYSLREFFLVIAVMAVAFAALTKGGLIAGIFELLVITITMAAAILSIIGVGSARRFAIGFITCMSIYFALLVVTSISGLVPLYGQLPTQRSIAFLYANLGAQRYYFNNSSRRYDLASPPADYIEGNVTSKVFSEAEAARSVSSNTNIMPLYGSVLISTREWMPFVITAHYVWALMLAYIGGKFATTVFARQTVVGSP